MSASEAQPAANTNPRSEILSRFELPVDEYMIHACPSLNLKADIAIELLPPELTPQEWYPKSPYRYGDFQRRVYGDYTDMKPSFDEAERLYAGICEKFAAVPLDEMKKENTLNHEFAIASTIIKNELRTEIPQIPKEHIDEMASKFWSYAHGIVYARAIALENYGDKMYVHE